MNCCNYLYNIDGVMGTVNSLLFIRENFIFANIHEFHPLRIQDSRATIVYMEFT